MRPNPGVPAGLKRGRPAELARKSAPPIRQRLFVTRGPKIVGLCRTLRTVAPHRVIEALLSPVGISQASICL